MRSISFAPSIQLTKDIHTTTEYTNYHSIDKARIIDIVHFFSSYRLKHARWQLGISYHPPTSILAHSPPPSPPIHHPTVYISMAPELLSLELGALLLDFETNSRPHPRKISYRSGGGDRSYTRERERERERERALREGRRKRQRRACV